MHKRIRKIRENERMQAGEFLYLKRLLTLYPSGIFSIVSDTFNLWDVLIIFLPALKNDILSRQGKVVIRPDSGNPVDIICGNPTKDQNTPEGKGVVQLLYEIFGGTKTSTGHIQLHECIGCIYGDAITYDRAREICERLAAKGFASTNVVLGVGSYTYQYVTRDVYGFAMKATWANIDGVGHDLFKKPITDSGEKFSATGRLAVFKQNDGKLIVYERAGPYQEATSLLQPVWRDGVFIREQSFDSVRKTLWA